MSGIISGLEFAKKCQWVFDPRYPNMPQFSSSSARSGDWVFLNGDYLNDFLARIPIIHLKKFTVIVHNSDKTFGPSELQRMLRVASKIYAINTTVQHPQLKTIPIGFADPQLPFLSSFVSPAPNTERPIEIYGNFTARTNHQARGLCAFVFHDNPKVVMSQWKPVPEYYADLCKSKFVLCPEGTGPDTHRVYESLLCGATPVVLRNSLSHLYEKLPVCIVDRWEDPFYVPNRTDFPLNVETYL
jgi:hypothetical protein